MNRTKIAIIAVVAVLTGLFISCKKDHALEIQGRWKVDAKALTESSGYKQLKNKPGMEKMIEGMLKTMQTMEFSFSKEEVAFQSTMRGKKMTKKSKVISSEKSGKKIVLKVKDQRGKESDLIVTIIDKDSINITSSRAKASSPFRTILLKRVK